MYAVIRTGGKQYRVTAGDVVEVEKLSGAVGDTITIDDVLMVSSEDDVTVGQPIVDGASITAKITGQYRGKKIMVFRYRPKKRIRVRRGHRQYLTRLEIESVNANGETYTRTVSQAPVPQETVSQESAAVSEDEAAEIALGMEDATTAEFAVVETAAEEPVVEAQIAETAPSPAPEVDETSVAAQEEPETETDSGESDSQVTDSEDSAPEDSDSEKEDKE